MARFFALQLTNTLAESDGEIQMKTPHNKLPAALKDPQSWISIIGVLTVVGLCAGAFEPLNTPVSTQAKADKPVVHLLASNTR